MLLPENYCTERQRTGKAAYRKDDLVLGRPLLDPSCHSFPIGFDFSVNDLRVFVNRVVEVPQPATRRFPQVVSQGVSIAEEKKTR